MTLVSKKLLISFLLVGFSLRAGGQSKEPTVTMLIIDKKRALLISSDVPKEKIEESWTRYRKKNLVPNRKMHELVISEPYSQRITWEIEQDLRSMLGPSARFKVVEVEIMSQGTNGVLEPR